MCFPPTSVGLPAGSAYIPRGTAGAAGRRRGSDGPPIRYAGLMRKTILGVMGPGSDAPQSAIDAAYALGRLIALEGWVLLSGGRKPGAMGAANAGAKSANGLTVGILPAEDNEDTS